MDDTLILANNNFAKKEKTAIQIAKIMIKDQEYLTFLYPLKFNLAQIKLYSEGIVLTKNSYINGIFPVTNHDVDYTSSRDITRKNLSPKK